MADFLLTHEANLRVYALLLGSLVLLWESGLPAKLLLDPILLRWPRNLLLFVFDLLLIRFVLPLTTVGLAVILASQGWGAFHAVVIPAWMKFVLGLLALDVTAYALHVVLHRIPWLWRIHAVHHSDKDFDCTTGLRFHPFEALLAIAARLTVIAVLGIPVAAIIAFEVWATLAAFYTHANVKIPAWLDVCSRQILITPQLHRVHHSALRQDGMQNYGVIFTFWDRLFRTYQWRSAEQSIAATTGLTWFNARKSFGIGRLIALPFNAAPFAADAEAPDESRK